jgi:hypothetical protein
MDIFSRHFRRADQHLNNTQDIRDAIYNQYQEEEAEFNSARSDLSARESALRQRERSYIERRAAIDSFYSAQEESARHEETAKNFHSIASEEVEHLKAELSSVYSEITAVVTETATLAPDDPSISLRQSVLKAYEFAHSARSNAIISSEDKTGQLCVQSAQLDAELDLASDLSSQEADLSSRLSSLKERKLKLISTLSEKPTDLTPLSVCVDAICQDADSLEDVSRTVAREPRSYPDLRLQIATVSNLESRNARRRRNCDRHRAILEPRLREAENREKSRLILSPRPPVSAGQSSEEITRSVNMRFDWIGDSHRNAAGLQAEMDDTEAALIPRRRAVESEWETKMERVGELQRDAGERMHLEVAIAQLNEEAENLRELQMTLRVKADAVNRRIEMAVEEAREHIRKDPEYIFVKERTDAKQEKVDTQRADMDARIEAVRRGNEEAEIGEIGRDELTRRMLAAEESVVALAPKIEEATQALRREEAKLDAALAKLPIHVRIQMMSKM